MMEPDARSSPFAFCGGGRDVDHTRGFFDGEATEKAELDDLALARIERSETLHGVIEGQQIEFWFAGDGGGLVDHQSDGVSAALGRGTPSGVIDEDLPHHLRGHGEKVDAVLPIHGVTACEAQVGFVDQGRGLKCMAPALTGQTASGNAAQFVVDDRNQGVAGRDIAIAPPCEEIGHGVGGIWVQGSAKLTNE